MRKKASSEFHIAFPMNNPSLSVTCHAVQRDGKGRDELLMDQDMRVQTQKFFAVMVHGGNA